MKARHILLVCVFLFGSVSVHANYKVGDTPPALEIDLLLQAPAGTKIDWESLKGKVVVLEFWATWCGPCIGAIPHLNEFAEEFKDKPIRFISVTDENREKVRKFLGHTEMKSWIGLDADASMRKAFGFNGIPQTVIIGKNGKIAALTQPRHLRHKHIETLLAGDIPQISEKRLLIVAGADPAKEETESPKSRFILRPAQCKYLLKSCFFDDRKLPSRVTAMNWQADKLLAMVYRVPPARVDKKAELPEGPWDLIAVVPNAKEFDKRIAEGVAEKLNIKVYKDMRKVEVLEMVIDEKAAQKLDERSAEEKKHDTPIERLLVSIERKVDKPLFNEMPIGYLPSNRLPWKASTGEEMTEALGKLGISLRPGQRKIEVLVIEPIEASDKKKVGL